MKLQFIEGGDFENDYLLSQGCLLPFLPCWVLYWAH